MNYVGWDIWGSHRGVVEYSILLGLYFEPNGKLSR